MKLTVEALKQGGVRDQVNILVGGAPVTERYAEEIGADGYGESAASAPAWPGKSWPDPPLDKQEKP